MGQGNPGKQVGLRFACNCTLFLTDDMLNACCHTSSALTALKDLKTEDRWPVLGVAVHTPHSYGEDKKGNAGGSVHVCWALACKQDVQPHSSQQKSRYLIFDLFGRADPEKHGAHAVLHTADSDTQGVKVGSLATRNHWHIAIQEGKGPKIDKLNGTKFFPFIKVKSLRDKAFKVSYASSCRFLHS